MSSYQTDIIVDDPAGLKRETSNQLSPLTKLFGGSPTLLLVCPMLMLIFGGVLMKYMSPIYSGPETLDYDPAYQYLFNGAGLMLGYNPAHTDHPGTPVQILTGLLSFSSWLIAKLFGLSALPYRQSIVAYSEEYLSIIMTVFLVLNCIAVYAAGAAIAKSTRLVAAGIACQAMYFVLGPLFPRIFDAAPEALLFLASSALMGVLAPVMFSDEECTDRKAIAVGFFIALGLTTKINFLPFFLLTFILRQKRPIIIALSASSLFMLLLLLPIIDRLKRVFTWVMFVGTHDGAGFDWAAIPMRAELIVSAEPILIVAAIGVAGVILLSKARYKFVAAIFAAALSILMLLIFKHFAIHYLMPGAAIAPALIVWAISRFASRPLPFVLAASIALAVGAFSLVNMSILFAKERVLRQQNETAINEVIASFDNPVVLGAYRAGRKSFAIQFGIAWCDWRFAHLFPEAMAADSVLYDAVAKKPWRIDGGEVEWSYLDQFDKAGRAVLIVQSRDANKIKPTVAQTETILDQGFGDTVERIIVSPKGNGE